MSGLLRTIVWISIIGVALTVALNVRTAGNVAYVGGPVVTLDAENRVVQGLGVAGNRIAALGDADTLRAWAHDNRARVVELNGRALLPGFIDAHGHFPGEGLYTRQADLNSPPIGDVGNIDDLISRLKDQASRTQTGDWVVGLSYDDTLLAERRHPTREDLDRASRDHAIVAWHISLHFAVANSAALARLQLTRDSPDPAGGHLGRHPETGELNGLLEENATLLARDAVPPPSLLDTLAIAREANRRYLRNGVTTAQSGYSDRQLTGGLPLLSRLGIVDVRMVVWPTETVTDEVLAGGEPLESYDESWLTFEATKLIADGSIQGFTGYLTEPYHRQRDGEVDYRGYPRMSREELFERVDRYHRAGLQIAVHGNGDASIDDILDAFENAQLRHPREDARHIIVHAQMTRDDQLDRMAKLSLIPSFFVLHTYYWGDRHRDIFLGPQRAARISPLAGARDRGVRFTIHADSPVVPMEPLLLVWSAVNRKTTGGATLGEDQRIGVVEALRATTIDAAYQHFQDDRVGSLEVGKLADLVILSQSPLDPNARIEEIEVLETIIGGRSRWTATSPSH